MSFFDDEDDATEEESRRVPRTADGPRPRSGGGSSRSGSRSGPPRRTGDSAVERRRLIAIGVLVVVVILVILLISSCQARSTKNSLENYNNSVSSLIDRSDATGRQVFTFLGSGKGGATISQDLARPLQDARTELSDATSLSVPGQMSRAQSNVVLALQMRVDGILTIANSVSQVGAGGSGATSAVKEVATGTARFYASDVVYKGYAVNEIAGALHGDNITFGNNSNIQINPGQFLSDLGWLSESFIATELGTTIPTGSSGAGGGSSAGTNSTAAGLHGDALVATAVGSTTLSTSGTNVVPASPAPTFTLSVSNGGHFNQYRIPCTVSVSGGPSGKGILAETTPGNTSTCNVTLNGTVTPGTYQVTVTIGKVPLETNLTNNTATYSVEFQ